MPNTITQNAAAARLETAWQKRISLGISNQAQAYRIFHGVGEASTRRDELAAISIDRFGDHYWVTEWERVSEAVRREIKSFLIAKNALSAVTLFRPRKGAADFPKVLLGDPPTDKFAIVENGMRFLVQFRDSRHPGLFLDHAPLRAWLQSNSTGLTVLNAFAYTGSLSVASGLGGASKVTTLDLSPHFIDWAKENWVANQLVQEKSDFIFGDVFDWLPKLHKRGDRFDMIILDPPSSSRGKNGHFSTKQNLVELHRLAIPLLSSDGILVTSINSANISWEKFTADVASAAAMVDTRMENIMKIQLPESFPVRNRDESYLKGLVLKKFSVAARVHR